MNIHPFSKQRGAELSNRSTSAQAALVTLIETARDIVDDPSIEDKSMTIGQDTYHVEYAEERLKLPGFNDETISYIRWSAVAGPGGKRPSRNSQKLASALSLLDLKHQIVSSAPEAFDALASQCLKDLERAMPVRGRSSFINAIPLFNLLKKNYEISEHASFTFTEVIQSVVSRDPGQLLTNPIVSKVISYFDTTGNAWQDDYTGAPPTAPKSEEHRNGRLML